MDLPWQSRTGERYFTMRQRGLLKFCYNFYNKVWLLTIHVSFLSKLKSNLILKHPLQLLFGPETVGGGGWVGNRRRGASIIIEYFTSPIKRYNLLGFVILLCSFIAQPGDGNYRIY